LRLICNGVIARRARKVNPCSASGTIRPKGMPVAPAMARDNVHQPGRGEQADLEIAKPASRPVPCRERDGDREHDETVTTADRASHRTAPRDRRGSPFPRHAVAPVHRKAGSLSLRSISPSEIAIQPEKAIVQMTSRIRL
jgi:hypothetical protein